MSTLRQGDKKFFDIIKMRLPIVSPIGTTDLSKYCSSKSQIIVKDAFVFGALLFRGFDVFTSADFQKCFESLDLQPVDMQGSAAPRTQLADLVFTSNDSPQDSVIPMHHEMAQTSNPPSHIMFCCETPSLKGGETPIVDSREISAYIKKKFPLLYPKFKEGVCYTRIMTANDDISSPLGRGWKNSFNVRTHKELEDTLQGTDTLFEWKDENLLKTVTKPIPAIVTQSKYGSEHDTFFNSVIAAYTGWNDDYNSGPLAVTFADGSHIPLYFIEELQTYIDERKIAFQWQKGDVLFIDNRVTMHSRNPFKGYRRILTCVGNL